MTTSTREALVLEALPNAMTYPQYRELVSELVAKESNTGAEVTEALAKYTALNDRRMRRLDKTLTLDERTVQKIKNYDREVKWLVLTESWCGDAAQTLPVMQKFATLAPTIQFRIVLRDEQDALMDAFLFRGGRSIPKLIVFDPNTQEVLGDWGPRPTTATQRVDAYKAAHGTLTPEFKQDLQLWYTKDKGQDTVADLLRLLEETAD